MYHIIFSPVLDATRAEKPVIGMFRRCLRAFSASTYALKTCVSALLLMFKRFVFFPAVLMEWTRKDGALKTL